MVNVDRIFSLDKRRHPVTQPALIGIEQRSNAAVRVADDVGRPGFVPLSRATGSLNPFKGMTEGAVPEIMQQGRNDRDLGTESVECPTA